MEQDADLDQLPPTSLEDLERRLRAMLYAVWRVRGVRYRIVKVENPEDVYERRCAEQEAAAERDWEDA